MLPNTPFLKRKVETLCLYYRFNLWADDRVDASDIPDSVRASIIAGPSAPSEPAGAGHRDSAAVATEHEPGRRCGPVRRFAGHRLSDLPAHRAADRVCLLLLRDRPGRSRSRPSPSSNILLPLIPSLRDLLDNRPEPGNTAGQGRFLYQVGPWRQLARHDPPRKVLVRSVFRRQALTGRDSVGPRPSFRRRQR